MSSMVYLFGQRPTLSQGRPFFIFLIGALWISALLAPNVLAQERPAILDDETKAICNKVMLNIYYKILEDKQKYPELGQFGESNLFENEWGVYALVYQWTGEGSAKSPFEFGVTIVPHDHTIFSDQGKYAYNLAFPFLGLKFAGYTKKGFRNKYNPLLVINKEGIPLSDHQQKYVPLQLQLEASKKEFKVNEPIQFDVELKNVSKRHMWVKSIKEGTLYCLFDKRYWGAQAKVAQTEEKFILKAGESVKKTFLGKGLTEPKDVEIYCSYGMSLEGVKPSGVLRLKVVP